MQHVLDPLDLSVGEIECLLQLAMDIKDNKEKYADICRHKILATLFFEPSTRTRLSFEAAMLEMGGQVLGFSQAGSSSTTKGESLSDTIATVSCYSDIIAMRHPSEGSAYIASQNASVPVMNAGDGGHNHPTQTLTDLLTIVQEKGRLDSLVIGLCGDLLYGRTIHSLIMAMSRYPGIHFVCISPKELRLPSYIKVDILEANGISHEEIDSLEQCIDTLDVLYMTRIQRERFDSEEVYEKLKDYYILDEKKLQHAKEDMTIMHPLPRVNEIAKEVDSDPRACYFTQVRNGKYIRKALILALLQLDENPIWKQQKVEDRRQSIVTTTTCQNPMCISTVEQVDAKVYMRNQDASVYRCIYCDHIVK